MTRQVHTQPLPSRASKPSATVPSPGQATAPAGQPSSSTLATDSTHVLLNDVERIGIIRDRKTVKPSWREWTDGRNDPHLEPWMRCKKAGTYTLPPQLAAEDTAAKQDAQQDILTKAEHNYIMLDIPGSSEVDFTRVCASCYHELGNVAKQVNVTHIAPGLKDCALCAVSKGEPACWTAPYLKFMTDNPTVFHVVAHFEEKLSKLGFEKLPFRDSWAGKLKAGGKYFVTRNGSTMAAFTVGKKYVPGNGVAMIGGHIDALTARLKPVSTKATKAGYVQLGVAPYAGGLNETWWDRDLTIGGRVVVQDPETKKTTTKLVKLGWPIARIPTLAPHFGVGIMGDMNKETQVVPIIGLEGKSPAEPLGEAGSFIATQPPRLVQLIAKELGIQSYSTIINWELELFDPQPATVGGMDKEFIFAGRIDDKLCSWSAMTALMHADAAPSDGTIKLTALFDDEEIGSLLRQGAKSNFLPSIIERTVEAFCSSSTAAGGEKSVAYGPGVVGQTYARSFFVSSDVCHAVNPNFLDRYLENHAPSLNVGVVVSADSNGHMTTDSVSTAICNRVAELAGTINQVFMIRNDSRSGGTIGPSLSSMMGVKSADVGIPQLSMHSIRATTGSLDPGLGLKFFKSFLDNWEMIDAEWQE